MWIAEIRQPFREIVQFILRSFHVHYKSQDFKSINWILTLKQYFAWHPSRFTSHNEEAKLSRTLRNINRRHFLPRTKGFSNKRQWDCKSVRKSHHKNVVKYETFGVTKFRFLTVILMKRDGCQAKYCFDESEYPVDRFKILTLMEVYLDV